MVDLEVVIGCQFERRIVDCKSSCAPIRKQDEDFAADNGNTSDLAWQRHRNKFLFVNDEHMEFLEGRYQQKV
jgi:hypothetical protein